MASNELIDIRNHGVVVDPLKQKVKCNYCNKVVSNGFYRLKYHLGGIKGDVSPCLEVPVHVKEPGLAYLLTNERRQREQQMLTDYAFVHYNKQMRNFYSDIKCDDIGPSDNWKSD
ncbi:hypothetical protein BUALT_Bualt10G0025600 [Buddleja alternifolia]|uniref:BED-type domain-containing protein n=1 Tax=Buddleja alternifolia TaxID=168488 RepID=A0AAV6X6G1_9LAMI|nr:hypothetical protein BUALT_Bualt10G0025600 [Buddleja alternifolia]